MGFKMKTPSITQGTTGHKSALKSANSPAKRADILIDGVSIGSGSDRVLSNKQAQIKAHNAEMENLYISKKNEPAAAEYAKSVSDEDWNKDDTHARKVQDIMDQPVQGKNKVYKKQEITYTGRDKKRKEREDAEKKKNSPVNEGKREIDPGRRKKETLISKKKAKQKKSSRIHGTGQKAEMERLKHRQLQKKFGGGKAREGVRTYTGPKKTGGEVVKGKMPDPITKTKQKPGRYQEKKNLANTPDGSSPAKQKNVHPERRKTVNVKGKSENYFKRGHEQRENKVQKTHKRSPGGLPPTPPRK